MRRFLVVPDGYGRWLDRDCFPRRLDEGTLARTLQPYGILVPVAGRDAFVVDPGNAWLGDCARNGLRASGPRPVTGADLIAVVERIAREPALADADIREIGLAMGTQAENGHPLYSLTLGTPRSVVRVQCFETVDLLVERAAAALQQARQATVW